MGVDSEYNQGLLDEKALLADRGKLGTPEVMGSIYDAYSERVYRKTLKDTGDPDLAGDVVGATFVKVINAVNKGRGPESNLRSYIFSVAQNALTDIRRESSRILYMEDHYEYPTGPFPQEESEKSELQRLAETSARILNEELTKKDPPEWATILQLRFFQGYSLKEAAEFLGKNVDAISVSQHRGIGIMRRKLKQSGYDVSQW